MKDFKKEIKILQELIKNFGSLTRTQAVKLLYLLDVESIKERKISLTSFSYRKYYYGPYDDQIITLLEDEEYFSCKLKLTQDEMRLFYCYYLGPKIVDFNLDSDERELISKISNKYKDYRLDDIVKDAYSTEQFQNVQFSEEICLI